MARRPPNNLKRAMSRLSKPFLRHGDLKTVKALLSRFHGANGRETEPILFSVQKDACLNVLLRIATACFLLRGDMRGDALIHWACREPVSTASQLQTILIYPPLPGDLLILQKRKGKLQCMSPAKRTCRLCWNNVLNSSYFDAREVLATRDDDGLNPLLTVVSTRNLTLFTTSYLTSQSRAQSSFFNGTEKRWF